ncbi:hypothetical protein GCM10011512_20220 [Tersicoccus solisilvae]|uniref:Uncharacterized protein n=1 Tax=Tersicoccus solisilvae TaxID=1882339 RepID=A0ABQ1PAS7_9MICC|nr:hypothetical protein [Tersicoccus solisilvae]GGC93133.1 hypothetical protein GCM10011512_20220 [Tersicoccus solisilvae]
MAGSTRPDPRSDSRTGAPAGGLLSGTGFAGRAYDGAVTGARRSPLGGGGLMLAVVMVVFLVAVVFAANQNDVVGWLVAIVAAGWLVLALVVFLAVRRAARFGATQLASANDTLRSAAGLPPSGATAGTRVVSAAAADPVRDEKLAHSLRIVAVQGRVIEQHLGTDPDQVARALETIQITAHNALGMLGVDDRPRRDGTDDGPLSGTVVD